MQIEKATRRLEMSYQRSNCCMKSKRFEGNRNKNSNLISQSLTIARYDEVILPSHFLSHKAFLKKRLVDKLWRGNNNASDGQECNF